MGSDFCIIIHFSLQTSPTNFLHFSKFSAIPFNSMTSSISSNSFLSAAAVLSSFTFDANSLFSPAVRISLPPLTPKRFRQLSLSLSILILFLQFCLILWQNLPFLKSESDSLFGFFESAWIGWRENVRGKKMRGTNV